MLYLLRTFSEGSSYRGSSSFDAVYSEAKKERVGKLDTQLEEMENELNNLSSKEPWQQNIFHSLTYLLYKTNPTMQSCIKAIQDFAFSGTGCRGGKHGDILWDEESSAIKSFMEYFNKLTQMPFEQTGKFLVWFADQLSHFNIRVFY